MARDFPIVVAMGGRSTRPRALTLARLPRARYVVFCLQLGARPWRCWLAAHHDNERQVRAATCALRC